jgi:hypothetical protein
MNKMYLIALALAATSCATNSEDNLSQAIEDFIVVGELEEADQIRHRTTVHYEELNDRYLIAKTRHDEYLVKFVRRCVELRDNMKITPDVRYEANVIRSGFDTIRGCRIAEIYPINKGQSAELRSLGDAPGSIP